MHTILPVTDVGVTVPNRWFGDATEVELREDDGKILLVPVNRKEEQAKTKPFSPDDPILQFGSRPVSMGVEDGSINTDKCANL